MLSKFIKVIRHLPIMVGIGVKTFSKLFVLTYTQAYWKRKGVNIESSARLHYYSHTMMELGAGTHVGLFTVLIALATPECSVEPLLKVGLRSYIGDHVNLRAAGGLIVIGDDCLIANAVTIVSSNHGISADALILKQPWVRGDVHIGDDVWIGAGVTVLPGSQIGNGAIVGAGAVVRGRIEPYDIVAGVPARVIGSRKNHR
jgi:acetyltransferase-like isoleucine patch superfamily enzyme